MSQSTVSELFWEGFCVMLPVWGILFGVNLVAALMLVVAFPHLETGSRSYIVALLSAGALALSFVAIALAVRKCGNRQKRDYRR